MILTKWVFLKSSSKEKKKKLQDGCHEALTGGFLCAVLDLSGIFCSLLIPEYSRVKRKGKPFPGLRNPGISFVSFSIRC